MKLFLGTNFYWMAAVSLSVLIGMGMTVVFCYILEKIYHSNFINEKKHREFFRGNEFMQEEKIATKLLICSYKNGNINSFSRTE